MKKLFNLLFLLSACLVFTGCDEEQKTSALWHEQDVIAVTSVEPNFTIRTKLRDKELSLELYNLDGSLRGVLQTKECEQTADSTARLYKLCATQHGTKSVNTSKQKPTECLVTYNDSIERYQFEVRKSAYADMGNYVFEMNRKVVHSGLNQHFVNIYGQHFETVVLFIPIWVLVVVLLSWWHGRLLSALALIAFCVVPSAYLDWDIMVMSLLPVLVCYPLFYIRWIPKEPMRYITIGVALVNACFVLYRLWGQHALLSFVWIGAYMLVTLYGVMLVLASLEIEAKCETCGRMLHKAGSSCIYCDL